MAIGGRLAADCYFTALNELHSMSFRKFSPTSIFEGRQIINDAVLITNEAGVIQDLIQKTDAGENIQPLQGLLAPGFVNAHCHLELSHLKDKIPEGCGFVPFLKAVVATRASEPQLVSDAISSAEKDMIKSGIAAVGDICNTTDTIPQKMKGSLYYHSFMETFGFTDQDAESRYAAALELKAAFSSLPLPDSISITPHAPYSVSDDLFRLISERETLISLHNQEDAAENTFFLHGDGPLAELFTFLQLDISGFRIPHQRSLQAVWKHFKNTQHLLLVHNVDTTSNDLTFISRQHNTPSIFWCLCPNANLYITGNLPDVKLLLKNGTMVLGTDSLASNHQLSILEEMKTVQMHFPEIPLLELLQWATLNGAKALRIDDRFGSFEKGKQPGLVLIENVRGDSIREAVSTRIL